MTESNISIKEKEAKRKDLLVRRAVECGLQLLSRLSHYRVYLTAEERSRHRSNATAEMEHRFNPNIANSSNERFLLFDGGGTASESERTLSRDSFQNMSSLFDNDYGYHEEYSTAFNFWNCIPVLFGKGSSRRKNKVYASMRRRSHTSDTTSGEPDAIDLELHIGLSCGDITNVILGDMKSSVCAIKKKRKSQSRVLSTDEQASLDYVGRLEYAICGPAVESLEDALTVAKAGEMSITAEAYNLFRSQNATLSCEKRNQFYVAKSSDTITYFDNNNSQINNKKRSFTAHTAPVITPLSSDSRIDSVPKISFDPNPDYAI